MALKPPTFKSQDDSGIATLLGFMLGQQKNQTAQQQLPQDAKPVGGKVGGVTYKSQEEREFNPKIDEALQDVKSQRQLFEATTGQLKSLPQGRIQGGMSFIKSQITGGEGREGAASKFLSDFSPATAVSVYRTATGDKRLSDADAQARAYPLVPKQYDASGLNDKKIAFFRKALEYREQMITSGAFNVNAETGDLETPNAWTQSMQDTFGVDVDSERNMAREAIESGGIDASKVKTEFKRRTGLEYE